MYEVCGFGASVREGGRERGWEGEREITVNWELCDVIIYRERDGESI